MLAEPHGGTGAEDKQLVTAQPEMGHRYYSLKGSENIGEEGEERLKEVEEREKGCMVPSPGKTLALQP